MKSLIKYIILTSVRDRFYAGLFTILAVAIAISIFLGSTSLVEQEQMTISYIAGSSRAILMIGMIIFCCLNVHRAFENREVEFIISKPISRDLFIIGYIAGFFISALIIIVPITISIALLTSSSGIGLIFWSLSLISELILVISFAILSSLILQNSFSAIMASFGFYILSRMMGFFVITVKLPENFNEISSGYSAFALKFLSAIFPRLDLFGQSSWLTNGISDFSNIKIIFLQSAIYIPLMIFMSLRDFKCKQF